MQLLGKMLGDPNKKEIKAMQPIIDKINALEADIEKLSDEQLAAKTVEFRAQLALYLKGGMVLEDQLLQIFREVLDAVEPLAAKCSDAQLREAITEPRKVIERRRDPEKMLRDNLQDTLSECFEQAYEKPEPHPQCAARHRGDGSGPRKRRIGLMTQKTRRKPRSPCSRRLSRRWKRWRMITCMKLSRKPGRNLSGRATAHPTKTMARTSACEAMLGDVLHGLQERTGSIKSRGY